MGPGIALKAVLQGGFSLMVFGWSQIVMDIQPLIGILSGDVHVHGFTHTYVGATALAVIAALTGKYLSEIGLVILRLDKARYIPIAWWVVFVSAFIGCYSHVAIDSLMHEDMQPFFPFSPANPLLHALPDPTIYKLCVYSALAGGVVYYAVQWFTQKRPR